MREISIGEELRNKVPGINLFCIECDVRPEDSPFMLRNLIAQKSIEIRTSLKLEEIGAIPAIRASRMAYKAAGKDPARYRLSAEALLRRIVKGEDLYLISNIVDLLNLVSITTGFSIGGYDASRISGDIHFGIGKPGEPYSAIGRGELNIDGLPVFRDHNGAFGSPTSDSERSCVGSETQRFLMIIIAFSVTPAASDAGKMAVDLLKEFAGASLIETKTIV